MFEEETEVATERTGGGWIVPFLCGLFVALFIAAGIFAAYSLKLGPFAEPAPGEQILGAVTDATNGLRQQIDEAAFNQDALNDPALAATGDMSVSIGAMRLGLATPQAVAALADAEARGQAKCAPILATLDPTDRATLNRVQCTLSGAAPAELSVQFAAGRLAELTYKPSAIAQSGSPPAAGASAPSAAAQTASAPATETAADPAPAKEPAPFPKTFDEPPPAPPAAEDAPPASGDAPPA